MKYVSEFYNQPALITSESLAWQGLRVERHQLEAMTLPPHVHESNLLLLYQGNSPVTTRRQQGSQVQEAVFSAGSVGLYPAGEYGTITWNGPTDTIHLYLESKYLEKLARQGMDSSHFALHDRFRFDDPLLSQLGQQLLNAVGTTHTLGLLYVESLTNALSYHLIEHHAVYAQRSYKSHRLSTHVLSRIDDYLTANATQAITLETLAGLANLSVFHFARLFKQTTGATPYQYVLRWKIREARQLLKTDALSIADISDALGFASPSHFSTAFKRLTGMSPREFQTS